MTEHTPTKREEVEATIKEVAAEKKAAQVKLVPKWLVALQIIFFPITGLVYLFRYFVSKVRLSITIKTTMIFTLMFGLVLMGYVIFIVASVGNQLNGNPDPETYMKNLKIMSAILVVLFVGIGAIVGGLASQAMLNPIRKMIDKIDAIDADNLSERLEPTKSEDELKELTVQINDMLDDLEMQFERQSNFISDASHELKTPLSVIQGYADLLRRWGKNDPAILDEGIESICRESDNMKRIVEQLLLLAKLGNFSMLKTQFDLTKAVVEITDAYAVMGLKQKLTFTGDPGIMVETDRNLLIESIRTLIDNAYKYTEAETGEIEVTCIRAGDSAVITVSDNGIGISEKDLPYVFERFYRCDKARGREKGSTGLGLTIAKSIIEMMGGEIKIQSKLGVGTKFTIILY